MKTDGGPIVDRHEDRASDFHKVSVDVFGHAIFETDDGTELFLPAIRVIGLRDRLNLVHFPSEHDGQPAKERWLDAMLAAREARDEQPTD